jgi:hypothetical protein
VDIDAHREIRLVYNANGTAHVITGGGTGLTSALSLGPPYGASDFPAVSVMNPAGGGLSAWPSTEPHGEPAVALREDFPSGAVQTGLVSGGAGGPIGELAVGRSGLGDGLVAFQQGPLGNAAIVAARATAPPADLVLSTPNGWVGPARAEVSWEGARSAAGPLSYSIVLDGHPTAVPAGRLSMRLNPHGLGDGSHRVQLLALDADGQATLSAPAKLRVDGQPPEVLTRGARGERESVVVRDRASGVVAAAVRVAFGDGHFASGRKRLTHRYRHAGVYRIVVRARDRVGNREVLRRLVSVR